MTTRILDQLRPRAVGDRNGHALLVPDGQPSLFPPNVACGKWFGLPVASFEGSLDELRSRMPNFERRPFCAPPSNKHFSLENWRYDVIVRGSLGQPGLFDEEVPVGLVSKQYSLMQHTEVLDMVREALREAAVPECEIAARLEITENGERIALHVVLQQHWFDPGDGHPMALRLTCFNSVDGSTKFMAVVGWLRFVCANGMVIGVARADIRRVHNESFQLHDIGHVLGAGILAASRDKERYRQWVKLPVQYETLARWVDGPVRDAWGVEAATRAFHISLGGRDVQFVDRFERSNPSQRVTTPTSDVPGMSDPELTAFKASQALAWLARERREISEQFARMEQIPKLMAQLTGRR